MDGNNVVQYIINVSGNAAGSIQELADKVSESTVRVNNFTSNIQRIRDVGLAFEAVQSAVGRLTGVLSSCKQAYMEESVETTKLTQLMRINMGATDEQIRSITDLASAQQKLGVIGDEIQLSGAQELSTYLTKTSSLKKLMPAMNDMLAQQYGLNASQEQAVTVAQMMGKVLDGQVGALSRYGYRFDEAQEKVLKFGTEEERVAMLSGIVEQYVGGVNEALAGTPEGAMKQAANNVGDLQEKIGKLWVEIQSSLLPVVEKAMSVAGSVINFFEQHKVLFGALVAAIAAIVLVIKGWIVVQGIINTLMMMSGIPLIVAGIVALIAIIVFLCMKIKGWGTLWEGVVGFITNITKAFVASIELYFSAIVNGIMIAIDKIKLGWYKFKEAVGIGDSKENQKMISQINNDVENRKEALVEGAKKVAEYSKAASKSFDKVSLSWDKSITVKGTVDKLKAQLGITDNTTETNNDFSQDLSSATTTIAGGGKSVKNFNIVINDGLVNGVQNYFNDSSENPATAGDFMKQFANGLLAMLNDMQTT
ncbi:MAG: hypothetical protein PHS04_04550 [Tissierellia bacterium]|nr:hypothetical protein [Tissierellia bacterium]